MLELIYTSPRKVFDTWDSSKAVSGAAFHHVWDAMIMRLDGAQLGGPTNKGFFKVFKDGHVRQCGDWNAIISTTKINEMAGGRLWTAKWSGGYPNITSAMYYLDAFTVMPESTPILTKTWTQMIGYAGDDFLDLNRNLLLLLSTYYLRAYNLADMSLAWQMDLRATGDNGVYYNIHWVSDGKIMLSGTYTWRTDTRLLFIDYRTQEITLRTVINTYRIATYDSRCGVVFAINQNGYVEIYYPKPIPAFVSNPVFVDDPTVFGGTPVSCEVLGSVQEPCEGWIVRWYLTNGLGGLEKEKTKTDENGMAYNFYFGPGDINKVGLSETIRAEVII